MNEEYGLGLFRKLRPSDNVSSNKADIIVRKGVPWILEAEETGEEGQQVSGGNVDDLWGDVKARFHAKAVELRQ